MSVIPTEVLSRIKTIEIKTRHVVNALMAGEYHSVFKGQGISFSEVRAYVPGDDVRSIDWHVTARTGFPHVKIFEEERELTVILAVDVSASGDFGSRVQSKIQMAAEIAGVLGFSAARNQDRVGLLLFSDRVERYIPPMKGKRHIFRILRDIFFFHPAGKRTSIRRALEYLLRVTPKKAVVFLISDFLDSDYERSVHVTARKHDVVPIILEDPRESELPDAGLVLLEDSETGETVYVNSSSPEVRERFRNIVLARKMEQDRYLKSLGVLPIRVVTTRSFLEPIRAYFRVRAKRY